MTTIASFMDGPPNQPAALVALRVPVGGRPVGAMTFALRSAKLLLIVAVSAAAVACQAGGTVQSIVSEGNLASENPLSCVSGDATTREHTPADIAMGMNKCVTLGNLDLVAELMLIASAYGRYDMERVTDQSAHQALNALLYPIIWELPEDQAAVLQASIKRLDRGTERHEQLCLHLEEQGPPQYYPGYMIAHGMGAFLGSAGPLEPNFDQGTGFATALEFVRCRESGAN